MSLSIPIVKGETKLFDLNELEKSKATQKKITNRLVPVTPVFDRTVTPILTVDEDDNCDFDDGKSVHHLLHRISNVCSSTRRAENVEQDTVLQ